MLALFFMFVMGFAVSLLGMDYFKALFRVEEMRQAKAIMDKFQCKKNEYSIFSEGLEDYYILSVNDAEYRVKFSQRLPRNIVYVEEVFGADQE